ncbi:MAG: hypothetical protein JXR94_06400, partial [Candidatus Hydrogenedentes bacterium]|nr:hypothetical protein [Candidatus Hydrogenedentota bacterium]
MYTLRASFRLVSVILVSAFFLAGCGSDSGESADGDTPSPTAYVNPGDGVYHEKDCALLQPDAKAYPRQQLIDGGYKPCPQCHKGAPGPRRPGTAAQAGGAPGAPGAQRPTGPLAVAPKPGGSAARPPSPTGRGRNAGEVPTKFGPVSSWLQMQTAPPAKPVELQAIRQIRPGTTYEQVVQLVGPPNGVISGSGSQGMISRAWYWTAQPDTENLIFM